MKDKQTNRRTIFFLMTVSVYCITVIVYAIWSYYDIKSGILRDIDKNLLVAAKTVRHILPHDLHDRDTEADSVPPGEDWQNTPDLSDFANNIIGVTYVYTAIRKDGRIYFTSGTASEGELKEKTRQYLLSRDEASGMFRSAFDSPGPVCGTVSDRRGTFRSLMVPEVSPGGKRYLAGADYDIAHVSAMVQEKTIYAVISIFLLALLPVPIILICRSIHRHHISDLKQMNEQLRAEIGECRQAQAELGRHRSRLRKQIKSRTRALIQSNARLEEEIAVQRQSEEELKVCHERFSAVLNSIDSLLYVADMETYEILFINKYGRNILGDVVGKICWQTLQADQSGPCDFCTNKKLLTSDGKPSGVHIWENQNIFNRRWLQIHDQAIPWMDGRIVRLEIAIDITPRKLAEKALRQNEQKFRAIFNNAAVGVCVADMSGTHTHINKAFEDMSGYSSDELLTKCLSDITHPDDIDRCRDAFRKLVIGETDEYRFEKRFVHKNGSSFWADVFVTNLQDADGNTESVLIIIIHIQKRKQLENLRIAERDLALRLAETASLEQALAFCLETALHISKMDSGGIYLLGRDRISFDMIHVRGVSEDFAKAVWHIEKDYHEWHQLMRGRTVFTHCPESPLSFYEPAWEEGLRSCAIIPISHKNKVIACFIIASHTLDEVPSHSRHVLEMISAQIGNVIGRLQTEEELRKSKESFAEAQQIAHMGSWEWDIANKKIEWSDETYRLFGLEPRGTEIHLDTFVSLVSPDDREKVYQAVLDALRGTRPYNEEYRIIRSDGMERIHHAQGKLYKDGTGRSERMVGMVLDITDMKKAQDALRKAKESAEAANLAKSEFLANMSHEIRTPLNAVSGFADLLYSLVSDDKQKNYLDSIRSGSRTLLKLINDILDLSKIEAGKMQIQYEPLQLRRIFDEIRDIFFLKISEKNLVFTTDISDDISDGLLLDEIRLRQILFNLIGNAIKFTDQGEIRLFAKKIFTRDKNLNLIIGVRDTGIGIPPESQAEIFESFRQQDGQTTKKYGGTGLGLTITKRLVEMMNGTIRLESTVDEGSMFEIIFRDVAVSPTGNRDERLEISDYGNIIFEKAEILIVDDIESNRLLIRECFQKTGIRVTEAENGQQALHLAELHRPDLILMDIRMPVMSGDEAAKRIRENRKLRHIPIIALTAFGMTDDSEEFMMNGFDGYLSKPIRISDLLNKVSYFIRHSRKSETETKASESEEGQPFSPETLEKLPKLLEQLENEYTEIWNTVRQNKRFDDIETFARQVRIFGEQHSLKMFIRLGNELMTYVSHFDIDNIERTLNSYPEQIRNLISESEK